MIRYSAVGRKRSRSTSTKAVFSTRSISLSRRTELTHGRCLRPRAETAERHPGIRVGARFYVDLSQPDRPHSAFCSRPQIGDAGARGLLGCGHRPAHANCLAAELFSTYSVEL